MMDFRFFIIFMFPIGNYSLLSQDERHSFFSFHSSSSSSVELMLKWKTNIIGNCREDNDSQKNCASVVKKIRIEEDGKRIYFSLYRRAQSLIYCDVEIAVNDICRECFILCLIWRLYRKEREKERLIGGERAGYTENDATWRRS